ncbi:MAG: hypothetical protein AB8I08_29435 [Sandaracinaceae bacterium]
MRRGLTLAACVLLFGASTRAAAQDAAETPAAETPAAETAAPPGADEFGDDEFGDEPTEAPPTEEVPDELGDIPDTPPEAATTTPDGERMRMIVIDAATFGIDPVVGRVASSQMRATAESVGYQTLTPTESVAAAQQLRMPYPPTPADLWRVSWVARTHRGAFARIWAHAGQYVVEVTVASLDGTGPFFARGTAGSDNLREVVAALLRQALPAPSSWDADGAASSGTGQPTAPTATSDTDLNEFDELDRPAPARPEEPEPEIRRWSVTLQTEAAIGIDDEVFYNHLTGARVDFRITRDIALGVYAGWVNLNGRDGRVDNILVMLQFENRIRLSSDLDLTIPLRAAIGYLPFNGPVIRLAAGLNYAFDEHFEMGIDILTPTFWFLPNGAAVSLDLALEATYRF